MSTLEKTISLLSIMPPRQLDEVYSYVLNLKSTSEKQKRLESESRSILKNARSESTVTSSVETVLAELSGILPDSGKSLEDYRNERLEERYGSVN